LRGAVARRKKKKKGEKKNEKKLKNGIKDSRMQVPWWDII
jgi:hypothetical protein